MRGRKAEVAARTVVEDLQGLPVFKGDRADARYAVLYTRHHVVLPSRQEHA